MTWERKLAMCFGAVVVVMMLFGLVVEFLYRQGYRLG